MCKILSQRGRDERMTKSIAPFSPPREKGGYSVFFGTCLKRKLHYFYRHLQERHNILWSFLVLTNFSPSGHPVYFAINSFCSLLNIFGCARSIDNYRRMVYIMVYCKGCNYCVEYPMIHWLCLVCVRGLSCPVVESDFPCLPVP